MKLKDIITGVLLTAAPVAATAIGGPGAGALVVTALGAGGLTKKAGKKIEEQTGIAAHKVGAPVAAIAVPALAAPFVPPEWMETICSIVVRLCDSPAAIGASAGIVGVVIHALSSGAAKVAARD